MTTPSVTEIVPGRCRVAAAREQIVEAVMDAQAHNERQQRLLDNPTPEIDSLREVLSALARPRLSDRERMRLAGQGMHMLRGLAESNRSEREHQRDVAARAEQLGRAQMTVKSAAAELRAPLGDLASPIIRGDRRARALATVIDILDRAPVGLLADPSTGRPRAGIAGELNSVAKVTALAAITTARATA